MTPIRINTHSFDPGEVDREREAKITPGRTGVGKDSRPEWR
jgi:hypothetical protein